MQYRAKHLMAKFMLPFSKAVKIQVLYALTIPIMIAIEVYSFIIMC